MKPGMRYLILLIAGIADLGIGLYAFVLIITQSIIGLESLWVIALGLITTLTGAVLITRMLPVFLRMWRGEPTPTLIDERSQHILHRAASIAFSFLIVSLIVLISVSMALPKWGYTLTGNELTTAILSLWITSILIFYTATAYYNQQ